MNATIGTRKSRVFYLSTLTTRDEAGRHFTERDYPGDVLADLEAAGLIEIDRPVHEATGLSYGQEHWTVEVTQDGLDLLENYEEYYDRRGKSLGEIYESNSPRPKLIDAPSGAMVVDEDGIPGRLWDYKILAQHESKSGYWFHAVRGPSGAINVEGPEPGSLNRGVLNDEDNLAQWVEENFKTKASD